MRLWALQARLYALFGAFPPAPDKGRWEVVEIPATSSWRGPRYEVQLLNGDGEVVKRTLIKEGEYTQVSSLEELTWPRIAYAAISVVDDIETTEYMERLNNKRRKTGIKYVTRKEDNG